MLVTLPPEMAALVLEDIVLIQLSELLLLRVTALLVQVVLAHLEVLDKPALYMEVEVAAAVLTITTTSLA
jgi:hypothetical protein